MTSIHTPESHCALTWVHITRLAGTVCTLTIFVQLHPGWGWLWCISSEHWWECGTGTTPQSPDNQHLFAPPHMSALCCSLCYTQAKSACSRVPGIARPTLDKFWSIDTITTREEKTPPITKFVCCTYEGQETWVWLLSVSFPLHNSVNLYYYCFNMSTLFFLFCCCGLLL